MSEGGYTGVVTNICTKSHQEITKLTGWDQC